MEKHSTHQHHKVGEPLINNVQRWHPWKFMLVLAMIGMSVVFGMLVVAFALTAAPVSNAMLPNAFTVSTIVIIVSGVVIGKSRQYFKNEATGKLRRNLAITLLLGLIFAGSQFIGWRQLQEAGMYLSGEVAGAYLYVISGLHLLHLAGGLLFLGSMLWTTQRACRDEVQHLIFITDPFQKLKLELLTRYWIFLDVVWVLLFGFFMLWF